MGKNKSSKKKKKIGDENNEKKRNFQEFQGEGTEKNQNDASEEGKSVDSVKLEQKEVQNVDKGRESKMRRINEDHTQRINIDSNFEWDGFSFQSDNTRSSIHKKNINDNDDGEEEDDDDDDDDDNDNKEEEMEEKMTKKQIQQSKKKETKYTEQVIAERERELLSNTVPETDEDFERMIVSSPNSSYIWIQYMAFKLSLTEIDAARKIARRALDTIQVTQEQEKFNIYAAWMNLESKFGTEQSQKQVFGEARQYCEAKPVYLQQAKVYEQNQDYEQAEEIYKKAAKKFKESKKVWEAWELMQMKLKNLKRANEILERSLLSLPKYKHLEAISQFAILHYKYGSIIQGNKIMEGIVQSHPNRTDMWSVFIDLELNTAKRMDQVRKLFERIVSLKLSTKKMKSFLQRYLAFETQHGSEEGQEHVKEIAREYIKLKTK